MKKEWSDEEKRIALEQMKTQILAIEEKKRRVSETVKELLGDFKPPPRVIESKWDREQALVSADHDAWWDDYLRNKPEDFS